MSRSTLPSMREAVAVFDTKPELRAAADALLSAGFDHADLSLLAGERLLERQLGLTPSDLASLEDDPDASVAAYFAPEDYGAAESAALGAPTYVLGITAAGVTAAAGGPLVLTLGAAIAAAGLGGVLGAGLASMIGRAHARALEDQINRGGLLLWVRTRSRDHEDRAMQILADAGGRDLHLHDLTARPADLASPEAVAACARLSRGQKIALLRQWAYDARERQVADEEGMADAAEDILSRVNAALSALNAGPAAHIAAPTKQGGV